MSTIEVILFDLDGTLVDTEPSAGRAVEECFLEWGIPIAREDVQYLTGRTWEAASQHLFAKYPVPLAHDEASRRMVGRYREILDRELTLVPGSKEAVKSLAAGYELALVSGSHRAEIEWALDRMGVRHLFKVILGAEDYPRSKPAPDGYRKAMEILGRDPSRGLVFEDSAPGIASARAAGLWAVAITCANHLKQDQSAAHALIPDLRDVDREWVEKLAQRLS